MRRFSFVLLVTLLGCGSPAPDEGLRVGEASSDVHVVGAEFSDRFALLRGGKMRIAARERGVPGDARIVRATSDDPSVAAIDSRALPARAARVEALRVGETRVHVTTESGRQFDAALVVEEAGESDLFVAADAQSACDLSPERWFDLRALVPARGVVYDVADFVHDELAVAALTRTRSGAPRAGWGGVTFTSSVDAVALRAGSPSAFDFGLGAIEFADARNVAPGQYRGPVVVSVGGSSVAIEITEHAPVARVRTYVATGGLRDLAHPDPATEGAPLRISTEFLGKPRECVDVVAVPFDAEDRPIFGARGQTTFVDGEAHVTLRNLRANVLGFVGRSKGSAELRVTFGDRSANVRVDVVDSER